MSTMLRSPAVGRECAISAPAPAVVRDPKQGPVYHRLAALGFSDTPGGARARADRAMIDLLLVASTAITAGQDGWLDQFMLRLDEIREAGLQIDLGPAELIQVERASCDENLARQRWEMVPSLEHARAALHSERKQIRESHAFMRGLRTKYPGLASR